MMYLSPAPATDLPGEDSRYTSQAPFSLATAPQGASSISVAGSGGSHGAVGRPGSVPLER